MNTYSGLISAVALTLLLGCAGPQVDSTTGVSQDRGVVVISVTHDEDTGSRSSTMFYVDTLPPFEVTDKRVLRSEATPNDTLKASLKSERASVYVLAMKPGAHQIDGWQTTGGPFRLLPASEPPPLRFEVKAGEIIYLGNLHMVNVLGRTSFVSPWVPISGTPQIRDREALDVAIAELKAPAIKGKVVTRLLPVGVWGKPDSPTKRNDEPFRLPAPIPVKK